MVQVDAVTADLADAASADLADALLVDALGVHVQQARKAMNSALTTAPIVPLSASSAKNDTADPSLLDCLSLKGAPDTTATSSWHYVQLPSVSQH